MRGIVLCCRADLGREARRLLPRAPLDEGAVQPVSPGEPGCPPAGGGDEALFLRLDRLKGALVRAASRIIEWENRPLCLIAGNLIHLVVPDEIRYVESERRVLHVHAATTIDTYSTLARLAELLPPSFVQCHKSYLVNLEFASAFTGDRIILVLGESIPVSQRRRAHTREAIMRYARPV